MSPFAPRKWRSFAERKATILYRTILSGFEAEPRVVAFQAEPVTSYLFFSSGLQPTASSLLSFVVEVFSGAFVFLASAGVDNSFG